MAVGGSAWWVEAPESRIRLPDIVQVLPPPALSLGFRNLNIRADGKPWVL